MFNEFVRQLEPAVALEPVKVLDKKETEKHIAHLQAQIDRQTAEIAEHEARAAQVQPQVEARIEAEYQKTLMDKAAQREELRKQHEAEAEEMRANLVADWNLLRGRKILVLDEAIRQAQAEIEGLGRG